MKLKTGYNANTKKYFLLGAGAIFKNFTIGTDTYETATPIGATQGGVEFKAVPTIRNIQVDGIQGRAMDLDVLDGWDIELDASFLEVSKETIKLALGAATITTTTAAAGYDVIKGKSVIESADYCENITYIGTIAGSETPIIIQIFNALNDGGFDIKTEDGKENVVAMTFKGHYDTSNIDNPPFAIYFPTITTTT